jgi:hypothetical protein
MFEIKPRLPQCEVRRTRACQFEKCEFTLGKLFFENKRNAELGHYLETINN